MRVVCGPQPLAGPGLKMVCGVYGSWITEAASKARCEGAREAGSLWHLRQFGRCFWVWFKLLSHFRDWDGNTSSRVDDLAIDRCGARFRRPGSSPRREFEINADMAKRFLLPPLWKPLACHFQPFHMMEFVTPLGFWSPTVSHLHLPRSCEASSGLGFCRSKEL